MSLADHCCTHLFFPPLKVTISNDGATIVKLLDIVHPAAKTLADISLSQDAEVGDGTTSVMVIAGELLKNCKEVGILRTAFFFDLFLKSCL